MKEKIGILTNQKALMKIAVDPELKLEEQKIFCFLSGNINEENYIEASLDKISQELEIEKGQVIKSIDILIKKDIFQKDCYGIRLNPNIVSSTTRAEMEYQKQDEEYYNKISEEILYQIIKKEITIEELSQIINVPIEEIKRILINQFLKE